MGLESSHRTTATNGGVLEMSDKAKLMLVWPVAGFFVIVPDPDDPAVDLDTTIVLNDGRS
jgi:hypothetical protein